MCENLQTRKLFSENERMLLVNIIEDYKDIIECKKTDGVSIRKKQETWEKISNIYNSHDVCKRDTKQLRKLWENIKQR